LRAKPEDKHVGAASGLPALLVLTGDEVMRSSAFITEAYIDPKIAFSTSPSEAPLNLAFATSEVLFDWYERPENEARRKLFGNAMRGTKISGANTTLSGFDWTSLPDGSTIIDVGGGLGTVSMAIAKHVPGVSLIVQDRASVVAEGEKHWNATFPEAIESGRVKFMAHDFFSEQPIKDASVFLLRNVLHDWADSLVKDILKRLREAATSETKLIVIDSIIPYACHTDEAGNFPDVPGVLLPTLGPISNNKYLLDIGMWVMGNGQERTASHFSALAAECGWKVEKVDRHSDQYVAVAA